MSITPLWYQVISYSLS